MKNTITENEIEQIALYYLKHLGYKYILGTDITPDGEHPERQYSDVVLITRLRDAIDKLNPNIPQDAKEDALKKVLRTESPNLLINNEKFHKYLTDGIEVEIRTDIDAPCLHTLYVDKPIRRHSLMQAIARVNRVFTEGKSGYPPDLQEKAVETVLKQAKMLAEDFIEKSN
jgi:type I site-specific restriction-modification system R (restriction) subunit